VNSTLKPVPVSLLFAVHQKVNLKVRIPRPPGKRNYISDIIQPGDKKHQPLKSQSESRMRHRSVAPQIQIPPDALGIQSGFLASSNQDVQAMLPLRSPDDFSDFWHEDIRRGDGFFVRVEFHVEGLDFFRVVGEDGGFLVDGFAEVAFHFRGKVYSPDYLFLKGGGAGADRILEDGNGFGVREALSMEKLQR